MNVNVLAPKIEPLKMGPKPQNDDYVENGFDRF
jgi:hypothetical protein